MNSVIEHILTRQNKSVPLNDGRKIALVLFGGLMCGVRGGASAITLTELGLIHAFDDIYTISAGFANASYFLANQVRMGTSIYYEDLKDRNFINFFRPWKIADIDRLINVMETNKKLDFQKVLKGYTRLHVQLKNIQTKRNEYLEIHKIGAEKYMSLMKAAISVPYLSHGATQVGSNHYTDPDLSDKTFIDHVKYVLDSEATDILIIFNTVEQFSIIKNAKLNTDKRVYCIVPKASWKLSRLCTNEEKLKSAAMQMGTLVKNIFGVKNKINLAYENRD